MYTVVSNDRPARRHLAVLLSAGALVCTLGAAWEMRQIRFAPVKLGKAIDKGPGWPMVFHLPEGFSEITDQSINIDRPPWSGEAGYRRGDRRNGIVLRIGFHTFQFEVARRALMEFLSIHGASNPELVADSTSLAVAGLSGESVAVSGGEFGRTSFFRAGVACLPNGQTITVMLDGRGVAGAADLNIFRSVCAGMKIRDSIFAANFSSIADRVGLSCDPLPAGRILSQADSLAPCLSQTASEKAAFSWQISVFPTFLLSDRTVESLAHDYLVEELGTPFPTAPVDVRKSNGRTVAHATIGIDFQVKDIRFVDLGEQRAAFVIGDASRENARELADLCERCAHSLRVIPSKWPFNLDAAKRSAAGTLAHLAKAGIDSLIGKKQQSAEWSIDCAGKPFSSISIEWQPAHDERGWRSGSLRRRAVDRRARSIAADCDWTIQRDGRAFQSREVEVFATEDRPLKVVSGLNYNAKQHQLTCEMDYNGRQIQNEFKTPDNFLPDPIDDVAIGNEITSLHSEGSLYRQVTQFNTALAGLYVLPCAPQDSTTDSFPIRRIMDFNPIPLIAWVDKSGQLRKIDYDHGIIQRPATKHNGDTGNRIESNDETPLRDSGLSDEDGSE